MFNEIEKKNKASNATILLQTSDQPAARLNYAFIYLLNII